MALKFKSRKPQAMAQKARKRLVRAFVTKKVGHKVALKNLVTKMINRKLETKMSQPSVINGSPILPYGQLVNPLITTLLDLASPLATIQQGTGEGQRIGNKISNVKLSFKGFITIPDSATGSNTKFWYPRYLKMFIFKQRSTNDIPTDMSDLFQNGNTDVAPQNQPQDMYVPFNKDKYVIHTTRMFKLATSNSPAGNITANNDFSLSKYFNVDLTKYIPSNVLYNDTTAHPTNVGLFAGFLMCFADGSPFVGLTDYPEFKFSCVLSSSYKDA